MPFSCDRSTVHSGARGIPEAALWLFRRQKCPSARELPCFFFFLNYVYLGLVEGSSNTADLEFKREALFLCLPRALLMCFFLLYLSHSLYNSPEFLVYKTGVFLFIILSMLAGYTQILIKIPHLGQCSSSQKALESHLPFKKKRFKVV